jgi:threonine dehydrogenase-like Zn-dependent dehydrogenase
VNRDSGITVVDVAPPEGDGVRVRIRSASICATDLSLAKAGPLPVILGHEMAGELEDGRAVAIEPIVPCENCTQCRLGAYHRCKLGRASGLGLGRDGGMAEFIRVPPRCLVPLPAGVRIEDACLVEPLAVVLHGLRLAELERAQRVLVIGGGSIGLLAVGAVCAFGCEVALAARYPHQRERGKVLGASEVDGKYDVVIDCAGSESALEQACELARAGGTLLLLSVYWDKLILPGMRVCLKELRILGSMTYNCHATGRDVDGAAALLARHPELATAIVTHRFSLEQARVAFQTAGDRAAGAVKVVLHPD